MIKDGVACCGLAAADAPDGSVDTAVATRSKAERNNGRGRNLAEGIECRGGVIRLVHQHSDRTRLCEQAEHAPRVKWFGSLGRGDDHRPQISEQRPRVRADMDLRTDQSE